VKTALSQISKLFFGRTFLIPLLNSIATESNYNLPHGLPFHRKVVKAAEF
jgi:hypothetical protein